MNPNLLASPEAWNAARARPAETPAPSDTAELLAKLEEVLGEVKKLPKGQGVLVPDENPLASLFGADETEAEARVRLTAEFNALMHKFGSGEAMSADERITWMTLFDGNSKAGGWLMPTDDLAGKVSEPGVSKT